MVLMLQGIRNGIRLDEEALRTDALYRAKSLDSHPCGRISDFAFYSFLASKDSLASEERAGLAIDSAMLILRDLLTEQERNILRLMIERAKRERPDLSLRITEAELVGNLQEIRARLLHALSNPSLISLDQRLEPFTGREFVIERKPHFVVRPRRRNYGEDPLKFIEANKQYQSMTKQELRAYDPALSLALYYHGQISAISGTNRSYKGNPLAYFEREYGGLISTKSELRKKDWPLYIALLRAKQLDRAVKLGPRRKKPS